MNRCRYCTIRDNLEECELYATPQREVCYIQELIKVIKSLECEVEQLQSEIYDE